MTSNIDKATGKLKLSNNFVANKTTTPEELLEGLGEGNVEISDMQNGWKHYSVRNIRINDSYFSFTFFFERDILRMVTFFIDKEAISGAWEEWSKEKELQKQIICNDWLTQQVGLQREFSWGTLGSSYDEKGGAASIWLKYK